ncbi:MAG TPA: carboxypeptidase-like regulatory domain-containing protein, partial [Pyrinomonadaceae bacterium]|nr:carboxypeptidase-like regulatory domain-containing protein [Pyrinomonadaceae bacterium]
MKPAPGTGNVQGKVLYNNAPVANIDVRLCETFSRFLSGCGGKIYTAKTDKDGDFVITNVPPKEYEGLTVRVFDTDSYVFATTGIA